MSSSTKKAFSLASTKKLNNNHRIPLIHLGVYQTSGRECSDAVTYALEAGYRAIDSAEWYANEHAVGSSIIKFLDSHPSIQRKDIWFTTKLRTNSNYDDTKLSIEKSIRKSGLGYIDLYLLHSPYGGKEARWECWRAVEDALEEGRVRCAGVSNFGIKHLNELLSNPLLRFPPCINQIEVHPFNTRPDLVTFCQNNGIAIQAYAPLAQALRMSNPTVVIMAEKYACTPAQLLVRWSLQKGYIPLPKSVRKQRIVENADIGGFEIDGKDMNSLDMLNEFLVTDWDPTDAD